MTKKEQLITISVTLHSANEDTAASYGAVNRIHILIQVYRK